jgi:predicted secreted Zn-dependent protease
MCFGVRSFRAMTARRTIAFVAALASFSPASALEKCVSADGKISYSEQPCAVGSKRAAIGHGTAAVGASPGGALPRSAAPTKVQVNYYDVQGSDFRSLLAALNALDEFHGHADWKLAYTYRSRTGAGGCSVESVDTTLELSMTLPRWTPTAATPGDLSSRWERYLEALRTHEEGHLEHGRSFETALKAAFAGMSALNCAALDAAARSRYGQMLEQYRARDVEYDRRTGHGKTQGAEFR